VQDFFHQQYDRFFVSINIFGGDCLKPGWTFMKHQQDSTEVCGCGDNVLLLAQIKDFRLLGFDTAAFYQFHPLNLSLQHDQRLVISPIGFPPFPTKQLPTMTTLQAGS